MATYDVSQADLDNGSVVDNSTATGTVAATGGGTITGTSNTVTVPAVQNPSIELKKTAVAPGPGNTYNAPGQTIDYSYKITNNGNVDLSSVGVTDPMSGLSTISCGSTTLAVGASETCTATYSTTQADVNAGSINNTGTASGTGGGKTVTAMSSATVNAVQSPTIGLKKTAVAPGPGNTYSAPGQTIDYSYKVTNTGNVNLTSVGVTDPMLGLSPISCGSTTLAVGASETCTATYTTTQTDVDNGSINNTGTASGTGGGKTVTAMSSASVAAVQTVSIELKKTAVAPGPGNTYDAPGQTIDYSYKVTNNGTVDLTSVGVTDPMSGLSAIELWLDHARGRGVGDLHGHLLDHPGRRERRLDQQHGHRVGHRRGPDGHRDVLGHGERRPVALDRSEEDGRRPRAGQHLQRPGPDDPLLLQGHQHRQRRPVLGRRHRPDERPVRDQLWLDDPARGRLGDLHGDLHDHPG